MRGYGQHRAGFPIGLWRHTKGTDSLETPTSSPTNPQVSQLPFFVLLSLSHFLILLMGTYPPPDTPLVLHLLISKRQLKVRVGFNYCEKKTAVKP